MSAVLAAQCTNHVFSSGDVWKLMPGHGTMRHLCAHAGYHAMQGVAVLADMRLQGRKRWKNMSFFIWEYYGTQYRVRLYPPFGV